jgi:hypothetical protein
VVKKITLLIVLVFFRRWLAGWGLTVVTTHGDVET